MQIMLRISWTEPGDSTIKPNHKAVLIAKEYRAWADAIAGNLRSAGKVDVHIEEI